MKYLILAAGIGARLRTSAFKKPKCFLEIGGKSILEHILSAVDPHNKVEKFIVVGQDGVCWDEASLKKLEKYPLNVIYNNKNTQRENAYSLLLGLKNLGDSPAIVMDGDIVFRREIFLKLLNSEYKDAILSRPMASMEEEGGRVLIGGMRQILRIGEQVNGKNAYIYAGIFKISSDLSIYFQRSLNKHEKVVDAINEAVGYFEIFNVEFDGLDAWININNYDQLERARIVYEKS